MSLETSLPSLFFFKCSEALCRGGCMEIIVHGDWHRNLCTPGCYGNHGMVCIQASLPVEELAAAGALLSSAGFTGGKGLGEASCHVGRPAGGVCEGRWQWCHLRTAALQHVLRSKSKCGAITGPILTMCPHFNSSTEHLWVYSVQVVLFCTLLLIRIHWVQTEASDANFSGFGREKI